MARLYKGWNALDIGDAVNALNQRKLDNTNAAWNTFADGLGSLILKNQENANERSAKKAALEAAQNAGIKNAEKLSSTMSGEDFARYVLGYQDENSRHDRDRKEHIEDAGFGLVKDLLLTNMASASGAIPSEMELKKRQDLDNVVASYLANNKDSKYGQLLELLVKNNPGNKEVPKARTLSDYYDDISALLKSGDDGKFSISLDDLKNYRTDRVNDKTWDQLANDRAFMNILRQNAAWLTDSPENIEAAFPELKGLYTYNDAERDILEKARLAQIKAEKEAHDKMMQGIQEQNARQNLANSIFSSERAHKKADEEDAKAELEERMTTLKNDIPYVVDGNYPSITDGEFKELWKDPNMRDYLRIGYPSLVEKYKL